MTEASAAAARVADAIANMTEVALPLFEAAKGIRDRMMDEGWSPTAAEQTAQQVLALWLDKVMGK